MLINTPLFYFPIFAKKNMPLFSLFSTAYFPPVEYFVQLLVADSAYIELYESYSKQSYRNRCCIAGRQGKHTLSIPVNKITGNHTLTKDITIDFSTRWQQIHFRSIEAAYNNSPFFLFYRDAIAGFFENPPRRLIDFNTMITRKILEWLKAEREIHFTESFIKNPENCYDFRFSIHPKTDTEMDFPVYTQVFSFSTGFSPNLSILDVLCNEGPGTMHYLQQIICNLPRK
jgi:hypothetical protein